VPKPEWGSKRICHACGARYYDLGRSPIICPKCNSEFDPEAFLRSRRGRTIVPEETAPKKVAAKAKVEEEADLDEDGLIEDDVEEDIDLEEEAEVDLEDDEVAAPAAGAKATGADADDEEDDDDLIADIDDDDGAAKGLHEDVSELGDDDIDDVIEVDPSEKTPDT